MTFTLLITFIFLNLFIGIILDGFGQADQQSAASFISEVRVCTRARVCGGTGVARMRLEGGSWGVVLWGEEGDWTELKRGPTTTSQLGS